MGAPKCRACRHLPSTRTRRRGRSRRRRSRRRIRTPHCTQQHVRRDARDYSLRVLPRSIAGSCVMTPRGARTLSGRVVAATEEAEIAAHQRAAQWPELHSSSCVRVKMALHSFAYKDANSELCSTGADTQPVIDHVNHAQLSIPRSGPWQAGSVRGFRAGPQRTPAHGVPMPNGATHAPSRQKSPPPQSASWLHWTQILRGTARITVSHVVTADPSRLATGGHARKDL